MATFFTRARFVSLFAAVALTSPLASGCGSSDSSSGNANNFPATPLATVASQSQALHVDVRTAPTQPPTRGEQTVELTITDAQTGAPKTGLVVAVVPWMPAMGHGASIEPTVTETSPGKYVVSNVELFMPGTWVLRTNLTGPATDYVEPSFDIP